MKKNFKRLMGLALIVAMTLSVFTACGGLGKKYTLVFDANGGVNAPETILSIRSGNTVKEPSKKPTREDYTFTKWYKEAECTNVWDFSVDAVEADTTVYAGWTVTRMTVTFDANGGKNAPKALTGIRPGTKILRPDNWSIYRGGYDFTGWYTAATAKGDEEFVFTKSVITSDITLYAGWEFDFDDYKRYAADQIYNYYNGLPYEKKGTVRSGCILISDIQSWDEILNYFTAPDKDGVDAQLAALKEDIAALSEVSYLYVMKSIAKNNVNVDYIKSYLGIEDSDDVAAVLDTIVRNAAAAIDAAMTVDALDALEISANAEIDSAVLEIYRANCAGQLETVFAGVIEDAEFDADETAVITARKAELLELLNAAEDISAILYIGSALSEISWAFGHDAGLFFYHAEKVKELREWVDATKAAYDFNPDALERIESYYVNFLRFISGTESAVDSAYEDITESIFYKITDIDGEAVTNWYVVDYYIKELDRNFQTMQGIAEGDELTQISEIYAQAILDIRAASASGQMKAIAETAMNEMGNLVLDGVKAVVKSLLDTMIESIISENHITPDEQLTAAITDFKNEYYAQIDAAESMEAIIGIINDINSNIGELFAESLSSVS